MRGLMAAGWLLAAAASLAQDAPVVRVDLSRDAVAVGEPVRVQITVLVPTWFAGAPDYPDFELANAITRLPPDSSYPTSERIGGKTWSGIVRTYRIYPLLGATYRLSGQTIGVAYANPGRQPVEAAVPVPEIVFRGTVPPGAESLDPYVAGERFDLTLAVDGETTGLEPGDAVVLEWTATLDGLPAIFIPPLAPILEFEGASVYADQPVVGDGSPGTRTEKYTFVFEAGGEFRVPAVTVDYWDTADGRVASATTDEVRFMVNGPPPAAAGGALRRDPAPLWRLVAAGGLLALLLAVVVRRLPALRERRRQAEAQRRRGEPWAFDQAAKALGAGDAARAYQSLLIWARRLRPPLTLRDFARQSGDTELIRLLDALARSRLEAKQPELKKLRERLVAARNRAKRSSDESSASGLPPLNPV